MPKGHSRVCKKEGEGDESGGGGGRHEGHCKKDSLYLSRKEEEHSWREGKSRAYERRERGRPPSSRENACGGYPSERKRLYHDLERAGGKKIK